MTSISCRLAVCLYLTQLAGSLCTQVSRGEAAPVSFDFAPRAAWVKAIVPPAAEPPSPDVDAGGIAYVLLDRQENVTPRAFYRREIRRITSEAGVQNGAAITVTFDPSYEKLVFHAITSTRDGATRDRLDRSKIQLLRREPGMDSYLYDGAYTAQYDLEDVRVGDVIEFAYTVEGDNPVKKDRFSSVFGTDWSFPVQRAVARVIAPESRKLRFRAINGAGEPKITSADGIAEWIYVQENVPARRVDGDTPADYDPRGAIEFTEYESWAQVARWAIEVFDNKEPDSADLTAEVKKLRDIQNTEEQILAALRFVQEEVRYLGIESGVGSHQPTAPSEVLRRRFGDCKDKVVLLATLLKRTGIDAAPALVSSSKYRTVKEHLPRPEVFDHAILHARVGETDYWLDATRSGQRGLLTQVYVPDFGFALVLRDGVDALTPMAPPSGSLPKKLITNNYRIPRPGGAADFQVISEYRGLAAERIRSSFREKGPELLQKDFVQYYARRFPQIRATQPITYEELPGENACKIVETYSVPEIWQLAEGGDKYEIVLYPAELDQEIASPGPAQRQDPLALNHPVSIVEEINAEMFEPWPMNIQAHEIETPFFRFREAPSINGNRLGFTQSYESLADRVPVTDLAKYNEALSKAKQALSYSLTHSTPEQLVVRQQRARFNWPIAALLLCVIAATVFASWRFYQTSKLPEPLPVISTAHDGLAGWLILVAFGLIAGPFSLLRGLVDLYPSIFNVEDWRLLTDPGNPAYHPFWAPTLLFALFFNAVSLIFAGLLLVLFFKRRAAWRRAFIAYLISGIIGVFIDYYLTLQIPPALTAIPTPAKGVVPSIIGSAIWIPYALVSTRVRSTFRY